MHVGELLMRMQLLAQDVQYNLRDSSDLAMMNMPKSQREIELIQAEAGALHAHTERLKQQLEANMRSSDAPRIAALSELDSIKLKAEGCVDKLDQAEKLDNLRLQVENAFRSDDLKQMAQSLGAFRASLVSESAPQAPATEWRPPSLPSSSVTTFVILTGGVLAAAVTGCRGRAASGQAVREAAARVDRRRRGQGPAFTQGGHGGRSRRPWDGTDGGRPLP